MKRIKGMFTVEMSFVLSLSFFVIFSCLYMSFFVYDICVIKTVMEMTNERAAAEDKDEAWMEEQIQKISGKLLSCRLVDYTITSEKKKSIEIDLDFYVPAFAWVYFKGGEWNLKNEFSGHSPSTFARITEAVKIVN